MRILGSTILDARAGAKYQVIQVVNGDRCELVITTNITQPDNISRIKQIITDNECELKLLEVM